MAFKVVKLNSQWQPMEIISWMDAFTLCYLDPKKASVLWTYSDQHKIRSQHCEWPYPAIIAVHGYKKHRPSKTTRPSLKAILARDMYICQYCACMLDNKSGTRDHVIPQEKGGSWAWTNLVACCRTCQDKKRNFLPAECGMNPINKPTEPQYHTRFKTAIIQAAQFDRNAWKAGFKNLGLDAFL